jgi:hypothetical protein
MKSEPLEPNQGFVAIHRWFAQGEGWAYHPWYDQRIAELLAALKPVLDRRKELERCGGSQPSYIPAMGGTLFVIHERDDKCPDQAALHRYPTILRAVYLLQKPTTKHEEKSIQQQLKAVPAVDYPGPDERLLLSLSLHRNPQAETENRTSPSLIETTKWIIWIMAFVIIGAVLVILFRNTSPSPTTTRPSPPTTQPKLNSQKSLQNDEMTPLLDEMLRLLDKWETKSFDRSDVYKTAEAFFHFLSQESLWPHLLKNQHPDNQFVQRLPETAPTPTNEKELRENLEKLWRRLTGTEANHPPPPLPQMIQQIEQAMDYHQWWQKQGCKLTYAFDPNNLSQSETVDAKVSEFVYRFLPAGDANLAWQRPAAEKMVEILHRWNVQAVTQKDAEKRPWFVFHCFFQRLSQVTLTPEDLRENCWEVEFVRRLPEKPLSTDGMFASEDKLVEKLRELERRLGAKSNDQVSKLVASIAERVASIAESMDYDSWKRQAEELGIRRNREEGPPRISQFVKPYRKSRHTQPGT